MRIVGPSGSAGVWNLDAEEHQPEVVIPRWPANAVPATGSDGHCDIVDPLAGVIHSLFKLRKNAEGQWVAAMYAWTELRGRGWGDPAHYYQGARAAAVPPIAGLIRKHEVNDGLPFYRHALSMSLTYNGLSSQTPYVFPATSADTDWQLNTGFIPEGSLLMLPDWFDTGSIANLDLRKVANTLKLYGGYVVDRNVGTPFYIYVENGSNFNLHKGGWNTAVANDLKRIQRALRPVVEVQSWVDGYGRTGAFRERLNLLSMRGPWVRVKGQGNARFDTLIQSVRFEGASEGSEFEHRNNRSMASVSWAPVKPGARYRVSVQAADSALFQLRFMNPSTWQVVMQTDWLGSGRQRDFIWPSQPVRVVPCIRSGNVMLPDDTSVKAPWIRAQLIQVDDGFQSPWLVTA